MDLHLVIFKVLDENIFYINPPKMLILYFAKLPSCVVVVISSAPLVVSHHRNGELLQSLQVRLVILGSFQV